jgi:uncharacterized protein YjbI with pentapeptide repeats
LNIPAEAPPDEILVEQAVAAQATAEETAAEDALLRQFLAENFLAEKPAQPAAAPDIAPDFSSILDSPAISETLAEVAPVETPVHAVPETESAKATLVESDIQPHVETILETAHETTEKPSAETDESSAPPAVAQVVEVAEVADVAEVARVVKVAEATAVPTAVEPVNALTPEAFIAPADHENAISVAEPLTPVESLAHADDSPSIADTFAEGYVLKPRVDPAEWALEESLALHKEWLDSRGTSGHKADLRKGQFESTELISVNLRYADLQDANLKSADLLLADLRDACLVRANFSEACLVGTNFEGANLEGASLENSMGLVARQLAGTNLHEASLPSQILEFPGAAEFARTAASAARLFFATMFVSVVSCVMIWRTRDFQLLSDSGIIPFLRSRAVNAALPTDEIYLIAPVLLLALYLWFVYNLQQVWDAALELPAIFPDGKRPEQNAPRIIVGLLRTHFRWMNSYAPSTRLIEKGVSVALAYWTVPLVLLFFWARYLTVQDVHGTVLHSILVLIAISVAYYCSAKIGRPAERWTLPDSPSRWAIDKLKHIQLVPGLVTIVAILTFLSAGTIAGVPHDPERAPSVGAANVRRWAPTALWSLGLDPYAELTEASISTKPDGWNGSDEQVSQVKGARLVGSNFRYAQAYGIFLANAHLFRANFKGAFMSEADMRNADLGQSNLQNTILDRAQMGHVNLDRAQLDGANLSRADLRGANLSYSTLANAVLIDARLDGASLYGSHLENASIIRGNLQNADLRDAHLDAANLEHSDLRQAYFWSAKLPGANLRNAQLATAIFIDADLSGADMRGAQFSGTVLNGANLHDANLDGADLRGALQLSAAQVCATKSRVGAVLDDALQLQVDALCGTGPRPQPAVTTTP